MKINRTYLFVTLLVVVLVILVVTINILTRGSATTPEPDFQLTPTSFQLDPDTSEAVSELTQPMRLENITIEYKPKSNTFVIYYTGDEETARNTFQDYITSKDIETEVKTLYISLDPITVTSVPPKGFTE